MSYKHESKFTLSSHVIIDGCDSLVAIVTGVLFENTGASYKLGYVHNGELKDAWVAEWRLTPFGGRRRGSAP